MAKKGRESVVEALETRFEVVPPQVGDRLEAIDDISVLKQLLKQAITTPSVQEFTIKLNEIPLENPDEE